MARGRVLKLSISKNVTIESNNVRFISALTKGGTKFTKDYFAIS